MPPGKMSEKVWFQDSRSCGGRIPDAVDSGWAEISVLLCITENPGIYCDPGKGLLIVSDHLEASMKDRRLTVENPSGYPVSVRILEENDADRKTPLGILPFLHYETIRLNAHESRRLEGPLSLQDRESRLFPSDELSCQSQHEGQSPAGQREIFVEST